MYLSSRKIDAHEKSTCEIRKNYIPHKFHNVQYSENKITENKTKCYSGIEKGRTGPLDCIGPILINYE